MAVEEWVSAAQREDTVQRVTANICAMSHAKGIELSDDVVRKVAEVLEQRAFTAAQVSAVTTTGARPVVETTKAYARKLSELLLEVVQNGGVLTADAKTGGDSEAVDLFGSRDFLTKESTEAALAALLAPGSKVKKVRLSTKSFGSDAAQVAATALANVSATLVDADLSDIIAGRPENEALEALRVISAALIPAKLERLNLSDNALGEKGVRACGELLSAQAALQSLSLQNVGCSIHACRAVSELLQSAGELRQLHLFNNMSDNQGAKHIADVLARAPLMEDFKMASSRVGPSGGISLARALEAAGTCLVRLDISDNPMTSDVAPALASLIAKQPHLRALNLNDTSLGNDGVVAVALALQSSAPQLEELELALNEVTPHGARAVALAVVNKSKLWKLNVRENELEDKGAVVLATALSALKSLRVVDACGNQLRRAGALALAKAVAQGADSLELLALDENQISEDGIDAVKATLESAGKLQALGPLDENEEDGDGDDEEGEGDALADDADVMEATSQLSELMNSALMFSVKR